MLLSPSSRTVAFSATRTSLGDSCSGNIGSGCVTIGYARHGGHRCGHILLPLILDLTYTLLRAFRYFPSVWMGDTGVSSLCFVFTHFRVPCEVRLSISPWIFTILCPTGLWRSLYLYWCEPNELPRVRNFPESICCTCLLWRARPKKPQFSAQVRIRVWLQMTLQSERYRSDGPSKRGRRVY